MGSRITLMAFAGLVVLGGANAVAVRFSNLELPPFWGAAIRFGGTALIFWAIVLVRRIPVPRGRALAGYLVFGLLSIGGAYAFIYWALLSVQAGLTMVVLAFVPLLTLFFALLHGLERFRWRALIGALIAFSGILLGVGGSLGAAVPLLALLALLAGAACQAEGTVVYKLLPSAHPVAVNALAVSAGALLLLGLSLVFGETRLLPTTPAAWTALVYLILVGSVILFYLYLFVLARWTASATSYAFLLFPVSTVILAAWLADERVTLAFAAGSLLVLAGVWLGAISRPAAASPAG